MGLALPGLEDGVGCHVQAALPGWKCICVHSGGREAVGWSLPVELLWRGQHLSQDGDTEDPLSLSKWHSVATAKRVWRHYLTGQNGILAGSKTSGKQGDSEWIHGLLASRRVSRPASVTWQRWHGLLPHWSDSSAGKVINAKQSFCVLLGNAELI